LFGFLQQLVDFVAAVWVEKAFAADILFGLVGGFI
jgi:hypothetical protein